mgnify:CR=1 FL=1
MKVFKNLSTYILALGFSATLFSGCEDYLNVSDDLAAEMTMEEVLITQVMHVGFIVHLYGDSHCVNIIH